MMDQDPTPPQAPAGRARMQQLHTYLVKEGTDVPADYNVFEEKLLEKPERIKQLHDYLVKEGTDIPADYGVFEEKMTEGLKKKAQSALSSPPAGAGLPPGELAADHGPAPAALAPPPTTAEGYDALLASGAPDPVMQAETAQVFAPGFTGPLPTGTYRKESDTGTVAEGAQYLDAPAVATPAAPAQESFLSALGKGIGNIPGDLTRMAGNVVDYAGDFNQRFLTAKSDVAEGYEGQVGTVTDGKSSDQMGAAMRGAGDAIKFDVAANARKSVLDEPLNGAAWGNLLGQGVNSVAQVAGASLAGGPMAGVAMGAGLGISATKDAAREAGLGEEEAMLTATVLAPIQGVLEEMGMGFITKNKAVTGLLTKTLVGKALAAGGGKLSKTALAEAASSVLPEVVKRGLKAGAGEAVTEFLQAEAEGIAKLVADAARGNETAPTGQGRYGITPFDALVKSPAEQAIGGLLVGGVAGGLHGSASQPDPAQAASPDTMAETSAPAPAAPARELPPGGRTIPFGSWDVGRPEGDTPLVVDVDAANEPIAIWTEDGEALPLDEWSLSLFRELPQAIADYEASQPAPVADEPLPAAAPPVEVIPPPAADETPAPPPDIAAPGSLPSVEPGAVEPAITVVPAPAVPAAESAPVGQKVRQHTTQYDDTTQADLTKEQRYYTPRKRLENAQDASAYIDEHGTENAYQLLQAGEYKNTHPAVLDAMRGEVASRLGTAAIEAAQAGNLVEAGRFHQQSLDLIGQRAQVLTEHAQALGQNQYAGDITQNPDTAYSQHVVAVKQAQEAEAKRNADKGKDADKAANTRRTTTVEAVLADAKVQEETDRVVEWVVTGAKPAKKGGTKAAVAAPQAPADPVGWGSTNKLFTKESAAKAREALKKMGLSTVVPPELVHFLGFHMEAGARSFADVSKRVVREMGVRVRPLLPAAYEQAKKELVAKGDSGRGFDGPDAVTAALHGELADNLADRIVSAAKPKVVGVFDPVREMLDTLTKKVKETLPPTAKTTPPDARDAVAHALNNRAEYADVFEQSKAQVEAKIDKLTISPAAKQQMRDELGEYHAEIIGQAFADHQFQKAVNQAIDSVLPPGKTKRQQLDALAGSPDLDARRAAVLAHVTQDVKDPADRAELAELVGAEFDSRMATRQQALADREGARQQRLRNQAGIYDPGQVPSARLPPPAPKRMSVRVRELLALRATDEQVARRLAPDIIAQGLKDQKTTLERLVREHADVREASKETLVNKLIDEAGLTPAQAKVYADIVSQKFAELVAQKAQGVVGRILAPAKAKLPGSKVRTVVDKLTEALDLADASTVPGGDDVSPAAVLLGKMGKIPDVSVEDAAEFRRLIDKVRVASKPKSVLIAGKPHEVIDTKARERAVIDLLRYGSEKLKKVSFWDRTRALQYAFRLSGLDTQGRNLFANALHTGLEQGVVTPLYNAFANRSLTGATGGFRGYFAAQGNGLAEAAYTLATGYTGGSQEKFGDNSPLETAKNKWVGKAKIVGRAMVAGDQLTSVPTENSRTSEVAFQVAFDLARNETDPATGAPLGLTGRALRDAAFAKANEILYNTKEALADIDVILDAEGLQELALADVKRGTHTLREQVVRTRDRSIRKADLLRQARAKDNPQLVSEAQEYARFQTLNNDPQGLVGMAIDALQRLKTGNVFADIVLTQIVPFMRIPANAMARKLEWGLPVLTAARIISGRTSLTMREDSKYSRKLTAEEKWKMGIRASVSATGYAALLALADADKLTLTGPPENDDEDLLRTPQSVIIGGKSYSYKDTFLEYPLTIMAALSKYKRKALGKGDDPGYAKLVTVGILHSAAWSVTQGPFSGPSDFASAMEKTMQGNVDSGISYFKRMLVTAAKTATYPALLNQSFQAYREWTGAPQRERHSNSLPNELLVSWFGNTPYAEVGEDRINFAGQPVVLDRDGMAVWDSGKTKEIAQILVAADLMPARQAPTDDKLMLYDPEKGDRVTPLSDAEFKQYAQLRGQAFVANLVEDDSKLLNRIKDATTAKEARQARDKALTAATKTALEAIEEQRATTGVKATFKLSCDIRQELDAKNYRTLKADQADVE